MNESIIHNVQERSLTQIIEDIKQLLCGAQPGHKYSSKFSQTVANHQKRTNKSSNTDYRFENDEYTKKVC